MTAYRLVAEPRASLDVAAAYQWYENERAGGVRSDRPGILSDIKISTREFGVLYSAASLMRSTSRLSPTSSWSLQYSM